jgi:hypothetical protein
MSTHQLTIVKGSGGAMPDTSGDIYPSTLNAELTMANAKYQEVMVMEYPTGSDIGFSCLFTIPQNYVGTPELVIKGVLDGSPSNVLAFGAQQLSRDDSESVDTAYETEDLASNSTWTGYADEEMYEEVITLTPGSAYTAGDTILIWFFRDDNVDTTTFNFLLTELIFQYSDV